MNLVDTEVHLLPPEWCDPRYSPPQSEAVLRRVVYDHPEGPLALSRATAEPLLAEMERVGVERAVIMGLPWQDPAMCWRNNEYIAEVVREHRGRFIGVGVLPPPDREDPAQGVRRLAEDFGLKGVKAIPSWQGYRLDSAIFAPALEELSGRNMVLVPHTDHLFVPPQSSDTAYSLLQVAARHPELRIMAPHLGGLLCLYHLHEPIRSRIDNILFVGSVPTSMKMIEFAVATVGPERVTFGTDYPFNPSHDQRAVRAMFESLALTDEARRLIASENADRFWGTFA